MSAPVFLAGAAYVLGDPRPIASLETPQNARVVSLLHEEGLRDFRRSSLSAGELAARALARSLDAWGGDPREIDLVIYCTERVGRLDRTPLDFTALCSANGISNTPVIALSLGNCANLIPGLRTARALLAAEGLRNVAVVTASICHSEADRVAYADLTALSDGAAACIVTAQPETAQFAILGIGHAGNPRLRRLNDGGDRAQMLVGVAAGVKRAFRMAVEDAGVEPGSVAAMLSTYTNRSAITFFASTCGITADRVYTETLADLGHSYAADPLIHLVDSAGWRQTNFADATFCLLAQSLATWGAAVMRPLTT